MPVKPYRKPPRHPEEAQESTVSSDWVDSLITLLERENIAFKRFYADLLQQQIEEQRNAQIRLQLELLGIYQQIEEDDEQALIMMLMVCYDMAKTLQYWGTGNFQEHPYTGRIVTWTEKEKQTVDDAIATKLFASGAGFVLDNDETGEVVTSRIYPVTGDWFLGQRCRI